LFSCPSCRCATRRISRGRQSAMDRRRMPRRAVRSGLRNGVHASAERGDFRFASCKFCSRACGVIGETRHRGRRASLVPRRFTTQEARRGAQVLVERHIGARPRNAPELRRLRDGNARAPYQTRPRLSRTEVRSWQRDDSVRQVPSRFASQDVTDGTAYGGNRRTTRARPHGPAGSWRLRVLRQGENPFRRHVGASEAS
jgi:hypothetical protein